jgi:hypothetical protein
MRTIETARITQNSHIGIADIRTSATSSSMRAVDTTTAVQNFELSFMIGVSANDYPCFVSDDQIVVSPHQVHLCL